MANSYQWQSELNAGSVCAIERIRQMRQMLCGCQCIQLGDGNASLFVQIPEPIGIHICMVRTCVCAECTMPVFILHMTRTVSPTRRAMHK